MAVDLGDVYRLKFTNLSPAGAPVNADTVTLTITLPDGTTTVVTPVSPQTVGTYQHDYTTVQAGRHSARWVGTGTNPGAYVEAFDVRPASIDYIVSLADAKAQLNIDAATSDEELRVYLEAATGVVERHLGQAVVKRSFTEEHDVHGGLVLNWTPVVSLDSLELVDGTYSWNVADLHVSPAGVVTSPLGVAPYGHVSVSYTAGMTVVPQHVGLATRIILQHLWDTQRGNLGGPRAGGLADSIGVPGMGFALPNRALELLGSGLPGIA